MQVKIALIQEAVRKFSKCLGASHLEEELALQFILVFMQFFFLLQSSLLGVKEAVSLLSRTFCYDWRSYASLYATELNVKKESTYKRQIHSFLSNK